MFKRAQSRHGASQPFHRRPRPPQCLVSVFNAVKLSQIKSETGNSSPPRDQSSCPSIASECQQMAETSSFLSRRRRYLFPLYLTLSSSLTNCLKRSKLIIGFVPTFEYCVSTGAESVSTNLRPESRSFVLHGSLYTGVFPFRLHLSRKCN